MSFSNFALLAHRGCSSLAPENTFASFKAAKVHGATGVELDVVLLGDGTPVVFHDESVERCTNGSGFIHELTFEKLQSLDAGAWFSPEYKDEPVPTLNEALRLITELKLDLNLEIKPFAGNEKKLVDQICTVMARHPYFNKDNLLFSSFDLQALKHLTNIMPTAKTAILYEKEPPENWIKEASFIQASAINLNEKYAEKALINQIRQAGMKCYIWTVNNLKKGLFFKNAGADGIITDCPQIFSKELAPGQK